MSERKVRVSIGMPVYNGQQFLAESLESLLNQTFTDFELIVSDNGSTDATAEICRRYAALDPRLRFFRSPANRGAAWNYNRVLALSSAPYFKWAAHDDLCAPDFLRRCVEVLDEDPGVVLCYTRTRLIDARGELLERYRTDLRIASPKPHERFGDLLLARYPVYPIFGVIRSAVLAGTGRHRAFSAADRVLLGELALYGRFHEVPEELFSFRQHAGQSTAMYPERRARMVWFDPGHQGRIVLPSWVFLGATLDGLCRAPLPTAVRLRCLAGALRWIGLRWRPLVKEALVAGWSFLT